jgi:Na+-driven multidrug efflux pump
LAKIILYRARFLIILSYLPIALLFSNMEAFLKDYCGQDPQVAYYAQQYLIYAFPKVLIFGIFDC